MSTWTRICLINKFLFDLEKKKSLLLESYKVEIESEKRHGYREISLKSHQQMCFCVYISVNMHIYTHVHIFMAAFLRFDIHTYITISKQLYKFTILELTCIDLKVVCVCIHIHI